MRSLRNSRIVDDLVYLTLFPILLLLAWVFGAPLFLQYVIVVLAILIGVPAAWDLWMIRMQNRLENRAADQG